MGNVVLFRQYPYRIRAGCKQLEVKCGTAIPTGAHKHIHTAYGKRAAVLWKGVIHCKHILRGLTPVTDNLSACKGAAAPAPVMVQGLPHVYALLGIVQELALENDVFVIRTYRNEQSA